MVFLTAGKPGESGTTHATNIPHCIFETAYLYSAPNVSVLKIYFVSDRQILRLVGAQWFDDAHSVHKHVRYCQLVFENIRHLPRAVRREVRCSHLSSVTQLPFAEKARNDQLLEDLIPKSGSRDHRYSRIMRRF